MASTSRFRVGAEEASVVDGGIVEESPAEEGALGAPSLPWPIVVLGLETTSSVCLALVGTRMLGCCSPDLAWADTMALGYCLLGLVLVAAMVLDCCSLSLALAGAVVLGFS